MYIKVSKKSQLIILRKLNPYLGKHQLPKEVLHEMGKIQKSRCQNKKDFIALFLKPVKNDIAEILDGLQLYPVKAEFSDENIYTIQTKKKKKVAWTCSELWVEEENQKIFVIYSMKQKHIDGKGGY